MAYEGSESAREKFGEFFYQLKPEIKTADRKFEIIFKNYLDMSISFNQACLNEGLLPNDNNNYIYIYIYIYIALGVFFLLLTSFIVCQAILDCLSSTESLILSIWLWMYFVSSLIYMPANWYCAVFSFRAFVFVGFFR